MIKKNELWKLKKMMAQIKKKNKVWKNCQTKRQKDEKGEGTFRKIRLSINSRCPRCK